MRHLVDAHSLIWALDNPRKLGIRATVILEDPANELIVSVGTIWELSIKVGLGMSFGAPKPASHRRLKPATVWGVLVGRIVLFEPVCKGRDQVVVV
jgi:hypothetical protein